MKLHDGPRICSPNVMALSLPLISQFSFWTQTAILGLCIALSYLHRTTRLVLGTSVSGFVGLKLLIPIFKLIVYLLKGIAWLGFYIYFIQFAITTAIGGITWLLEDGLPRLVNEMDRGRAPVDEPDPSMPSYSTDSRVEEVD